MVRPNPHPTGSNFRVKAVFERGVFRPIDPVSLPESANVDLDVHAPVEATLAAEARAWFQEASRSGKFRAEPGYTFSRDEIYDRSDRD
jgi:predicted DNA-binding antitoxin AbrB/MazE fold protein